MPERGAQPAPATPNATVPIPPTPQAAPTPPEKVVLEVGSEKITAGELNQLIDNLPEQIRAFTRSGAGRKQFAENLIRMKLLAQEGRARKIDESPAYQRQLQLQRDQVLANLTYQDLNTNVKVDEAALRKYYEEHKSEFEQARARHVLVRFQGSPVALKPDQKDLTEQEALEKATAIRNRLRLGEDFAKVAKEESDDSGSGAQGGDLGFFKHGAMVPVFEQAAFSLPIGQLSEPVKSQFGYHIIRVEQREAKTFDEVKSEIEKRLRPERARQAIEDLRAKYPVKMDEGYFGQ